MVIERSDEGLPYPLVGMSFPTQMSAGPVASLTWDGGEFPSGP